MVWKENRVQYIQNAWNSHRLSDEHVPLLYYAPSLLQPQTYHYTVSQIDLLPTLAGMIHQPYTNTTLGRDVINQPNIFARRIYHSS